MKYLEVAKKAAKAHGGKASEYISEAMKIAWQAAKANKSKIVESALLAAGGKRWQKSNMNRIYFNFSVIDFKIELAEAVKLSSIVVDGKYYYDCNTREVRADCANEKVAALAISKIKKLIAA